ncbi:hypothetical protein JCM31826_13360 [Thermaurantimonas aggregans]|uniref:Tr-type G domain-containing protein n=1 Tax=Thermaurantimonas aggregans TaxID=2173829 RepID=A0A401XLI9_9FLAO|nr:GTP-binding protein [Thermaurantimonas aggregans]MCX8149106.1 GTP-binding protein [Thermaurantimonas aggregans]GCD77854.1 hypothetical protein JCM31826_13360 [Thermaurantimonas aggregans]
MTTVQQKIFKVAIAGSTDDGKSTLLGRLLIDSENVTNDQLEAISAESQRLGRPTPEIAWLTDGLSTEQAQRITIDVAYRTIRWKGWRMLLIDTPGHLEYIQNTTTGLSQADSLVLLVDISRDFTDQTLRHLQLAKMFSISHIAVVVNKMDTVGYRSDIFESFVSKFSSAAGKYLPPSVHYIPASALYGHNVVKNQGLTPWYSGVTLLEHLQRIAESCTPSSPTVEPHPVAIGKIFWTLPTINGAGIKVISGMIEVGKKLYLPLRDNQEVMIKKMYHHGQQVKSLRAGQSGVIIAEAQYPFERDWMLTDSPLSSTAIVVQVDALQLLPISMGHKYTWITPLGTFPLLGIKILNSNVNPLQLSDFPKFVSLLIEISLFSIPYSRCFDRGLLIDSDGRVVVVTGVTQVAKNL